VSHSYVEGEIQENCIGLELSEKGSLEDQSGEQGPPDFERTSNTPVVKREKEDKPGANEPQGNSQLRVKDRGKQGKTG